MPITRRSFLKGMGVAVGGAGLAAGSPNLLVPYVEQPQDFVPGVSAWYATSCRECPAGCGMVVRNVQSRVVKCEGNPAHPINRGTLCARGQAAVTGLYDPDRVRGPQRRRTSAGFRAVSWDEALRTIGEDLRGRGRIALVSDLRAGSLDALMRAWIRAFGSDRLVIYEPMDYQPAKAAFGGVVPALNIAACDYLVSFGADLLETWVSPVEYAREFAAMREVRDGSRAGFAYIGPRLSMTAANADVRILVPPGALTEAASAIAAAMRDDEAPARGLSDRYGVDPDDVRRIARGLAGASSPLVLPGWLPESADAVRALGVSNGPGTVDPARPHAVSAIAGRAEIDRLVSDMDSGLIDALVIFGANPVYSLPDSGRFVEALRRVGLVVSLSSFMDETSAHAHWLLPSSTPLESWGDYHPYPNVVNLMQPTMASLLDTRDTGEILMQVAAAAGRDPVAAFGVRNYYEFLRRRWGTADWESLLARGGQWPDAAEDATPSTGYQTLAEAGFGSGVAVAGTPPPTPPSQGGEKGREPHPSPLLGGEGVGASPASQGGAFSTPPLTKGGPGGVAAEAGGIRLYAFPHIYYYDGRNANRRWLQEIPEPVTKAVWGTWAEINSHTAKRLGIRLNDVIEVEAGGRKLRLSAYVWPGVARDTIAVPIGEGHEAYGRFASDVGVNVYPLLETPAPSAEVRATGGSKWLTRIKGSRFQHGRPIVQTVRLDEPFERDEHEIAMPLPEGYGEEDFYPGHEHYVHRWAMTVDLNRCIGCGACTTACYAENNIGIVGPEGIYRRREMSWLRIDLYYDWKSRSAPVLFQPMLCQHCDAAPCEPVCPVFAAAHSDEGLNMQVYNRCVGTRYCANNCPYKVRRFNWFDYDWPEPLNWQLNPDVTVRCRGVMEKCTFCIQRIRQAEIVAKREGRDLRDGEITPACAATCPTGVFTFGDLTDGESRVSRIVRDDPRAYQVLRELNTKTAVIYLKRIVDVG